MLLYVLDPVHRPVKISCWVRHLPKYTPKKFLYQETGQDHLLQGGFIEILIRGRQQSCWWKWGTPSEFRFPIIILLLRLKPEVIPG
jgi:hypothetical protein